MTATPIKHSRIGLAVAVVVTALGLAASAQARVPVEPGPGSPVTHQHVRVPAKKHVKRSSKRLEGGFPAVAGTHVKSQAELRTE